MKIPSSIELKTFVPSKNFKESKEFYKDIGFDMTWEGESVAQFRIGNFQFLLQAHYVKDHADKFVMFF